MQPSDALCLDRLSPVEAVCAAKVMATSDCLDPRPLSSGWPTILVALEADRQHNPKVSNSMKPLLYFRLKKVYNIGLMQLLDAPSLGI